MTPAMMAVLCVLAGAVATAFGVLLLVPVVRWAVVARASAEGTVIGHDRTDTPEATWYYPRVAFTAEGRELVIRGLLGYGRPRPSVGSRVRVYFPPGDPQAAELGRAGGVLVAAGLLAIGVAVATLGAWGFVRG